MKIVIVGASGVIGQHLKRTWENEHEVIAASARKSEHQVNIESVSSIRQFLQGVAPFDALITVAGSAPMKPLADLRQEDFDQAFRSKLMGQINFVLEGCEYLNSGGSFTLVSGILSEDPIPNGIGLTTVNSALNGFVKAAALELLPENKRINIVSPGLLEDSAERLSAAFPGHVPVEAHKVVNAFEKSLFGLISGEVIKVY